mmetsp:Transcript_27378/g.40546  ORF Transcript_27378/g.40546 Transcript_27378/m.40546 type:complete len:110 (+) Transcript_27378:411-740(+)
MRKKKLAYPTPYHAAVKFGDMKHLKNILEQDNGDDVDYQQGGFEERTAMDLALAALTGKFSFVQFRSCSFDDNKGSFKIKSPPRMNRIAKNRESEPQKYLEIVVNNSTR